jgi:hypothetical protein
MPKAVKKKNSDIQATNHLCDIVRAGKVQLLKGVEHDHTQLDKVRQATKDRVVVTRRRHEADLSLRYLSTDPLTFKHEILRKGPAVTAKLKAPKKKVSYNPVHLMPIIIAAEEVLKAKRGFDFFKGVIGQSASGMPNIVRSAIYYRWLLAFARGRYDKKIKFHHFTMRPDIRTVFHKELRPALKFLFNTVRNGGQPPVQPSLFPIGLPA